MSYPGFGPTNTQSSYLAPEFDLPVDLVRFQDFVSKRERLTASILNVKENGNYDLQELLTAQQWFSIQTTPKKTRYSFRKTFDMVALNGGNIAAGATFSTAHGITGITIPTRIFGTATTTTPRYLPLPYVSATANLNIEIYADNTNVVIINGAGQPALTQCYITLEYLKQ
jgi:hypothetical protein